MKLDEALKVLGLEQICTEEDAKKAYRSLALKHHPDRCRGNVEEATATFKRIGALRATTQPVACLLRGPATRARSQRARVDQPRNPLDRTRRAQARPSSVSKSSTRRG